MVILLAFTIGANIDRKTIIATNIHDIHTVPSEYTSFKFIVGTASNVVLRIFPCIDLNNLSKLFINKLSIPKLKINPNGIAITVIIIPSKRYILNICFFVAPIEERAAIYFFFSLIDILNMVYIKAIDDIAIIPISKPNYYCNACLKF